MKFGENLRRFNNLHYELESVYHGISVKLGMSDSAMMILYELCNAGGECSFGRITACTGLSKQTVSSSLQKLESEGILAVFYADGRRKSIRLTDKGVEYTKENVCLMIEAENNSLAVWSKEELERYCELTEKYINSMREFSKSLERGKNDRK